MTTLGKVQTENNPEPTMSDNKYSPPEELKGDQAHKLIRSVIGAAPFVGTAGVEIFTSIFAPPLVRRNNKWMENVANGLQRLEKKGILSIEQLADNDAFIDVLFTATRIAAQTSNEDKLKSLVNAVLNASQKQNPDEALQQMFLEVLSSMTGLHLKILKHVEQPFDENHYAYGRYDNHYEVPWSETHAELLKEFPDLVGKEAFVEEVVYDLERRRLMAREGTDGIIPWGNRFLSFISNN